MYFKLDNYKSFDNILKSNIDYQISDFIDDINKQHIKDMDDMFFKFLTENGYNIDKPYNIEQLEKIKRDLAKQDKFLDYMSYSEYKHNTLIWHAFPFFNCISNPLSEDDKEDIIRRWKNVNNR